MASDELYQLYYKDNNPILPIRGFCTTVENNCVVRRAAEALGVEPATISKQIKALERKLGVVLFESKDNSDRKGSKLRLTKDGEIFYEKAKPIIFDLDRLFSEYSQKLDNINESSINVATTSFMVQKLISYIPSFKNAFKEENLKDISILITSQEDGIKMLSDKKIDMFISHKEKDLKLPYNIDFVKLANYIPYLVLYKGHHLEKVESKNITINDLVNSGLGFNQNGITLKAYSDIINTYNIKSKIPINTTIDAIEIQKTLIENKLCVCVIFNVFLSDKDKKYFAFKDISHLLSKGEYGYYVLKDNKKKILANFSKFLMDTKKTRLE